MPSIKIERSGFSSMPRSMDGLGSRLVVICYGNLRIRSAEERFLGLAPAWRKLMPPVHGTGTTTSVIVRAATEWLPG
ncbi:hypothetical protein PSHT_13362 [Puccinia striiformis]|uniref:Uncharacterized protein n=2 Tax=Puccinia striiformis TaxID=27350 RepID=A0A0L0V4B4_9BASI|nr:hypothetical protein H4Q26_010459 [Puccinia striiformis f. sp. tritici PST-130]KAI9618560.1 hypothetical protein H4Q26_012381 [Puccinia striiformis f. sp. tritici PST-130]KAI9628426.1 hypothetical protein KEM48_011709 [Puccinia striiformis f. sp. tritici PST-130]KNE93824.1 hypothetical protein PSTG_12825 [Puccinia striiformis f. sp. tritici PST-78]POV99850.1 hypothetical protein PSHT_13362 [Puccinia striiformis]